MVHALPRGRRGTVVALSTELALSTLRRGGSPYAPAALAAWEMVCVSENRIDEGYRMGELAPEIQQREGSPLTRAVVLTIDNFFIKPWKPPWREALPRFRRAMEAGINAGEYDHAAAAGHFYANFAIFSGDQDLHEVSRQIGDLTRTIDGLHQERLAIGIRRHHQMALNLIQSPADAPPYAFAGPAFDDAAMVPVLEAAGNSSALAILATYRLILAYLFDENRRALDFAADAEALLPSVRAQPTVHMAVFYHSLALLSSSASPAAVSSSSRRSALRKIHHYRRLLNTWAQASPVNFRHRRDLVSAEYLALRKDNRAERTFLEAIAGAAASGYVQDEALAYRRFALHLQASGREQEGREHLRKSCRLSGKWGATAIVRYLEGRHPWLLEQEIEARRVPSATVGASERSAGPAVCGAGDLDIETLMSAGRIISSQVNVDALLERVIKIIMQCAWAARGVLEIEEDGKLVASVEGTAKQEGVSVSPRRGELSERMDSPVANLVRQTRESFVAKSSAVGEVNIRHPWSSSSHRSVLCAPLQHQGTLVGIVYLENSLAAGMFTSGRVRVVELLAAQAAVSFQNAALYELKDALSQQREQLLREDRLASLGTLVTNVAHEVSSPNHVIGLDSDYLRQEAARLFSELNEAMQDSLGARAEDPSPPPSVTDIDGDACIFERRRQFDRALQRISDASARIEAMVEELKDFARGRKRRPFQSIGLNEVVASTLRLSETLIRSARKRNHGASLRRTS